MDRYPGGMGVSEIVNIIYHFENACTCFVILHLNYYYFVITSCNVMCCATNNTVVVPVVELAVVVLTMIAALCLCISE